VESSCERGNEPSGSIKCWEIYRVATQLVASGVVLSVIELVNRMASSGMLRRVARIRTDVSEELRASFIRVTRISEPGTRLALTSNQRKLRRNTKRASVASYS
jgi:hypothetical protein